ncbi:MAG: hypothetical protein FWE94_00100 [Coriobacteriia bacterium]|nr:hypothetical protein [Coriobacteriia bacterium]
MSGLGIESIDVSEACIEAKVRIAEGVPVRTSAISGLAERALQLLPGLGRHRCLSRHRRDAGASCCFAEELRDTEIPHLLEHLTIELLALAGSPRSLPAHTAWDFAHDGRRVFRVWVACDDDVVALRALKEANTVLDWLLGMRDGEPDVGAITDRLAKMRRRA